MDIQIGHAIELLSCGEINHGEGVAFGMLVMAHISCEHGFLSKKELDIHYNLLISIEIIEKLQSIIDISTNQIVSLIYYDNKRGYIPCKEDEVPMVVLKSLGNCCKTNNVRLIAVNINLISKCIDIVKDQLNMMKNGVKTDLSNWNNNSKTTS